LVPRKEKEGGRRMRMRIRRVHPSIYRLPLRNYPRYYLPALLLSTSASLFCHPG
jgi:hypothetical protein